MTDATTPTQTPPEPIEAPQEPIAAPPLPYMLRANLREYRKRLGLWRILLALGLTVLFFFKLGFLGWLLSVAGIALIIVIILWFLGKRTLEVTSSELVYRSALGKARNVAYTDIEGVKVFVNYYEPTFGVAPRVTIGLKKGEPLSLYALYWPIDDLDKLLAVLRDKSVPTEYYADPATYAMIAQQFPKYATLIERHPWRIAWAIVGAIVVIVTVAVVGFEFWW
ncbi:hypothetical protein BGO17_04080 [Candidatus Saccharibacteria bacterium 49-20]|nr:MAG: hypothetical protein BGO17_04080 [Candidatus Saccharibacteria bacterium 49-20]